MKVSWPVMLATVSMTMLVDMAGPQGHDREGQVYV